MNWLLDHVEVLLSTISGVVVGWFTAHMQVSKTMAEIKNTVELVHKDVADTKELGARLGGEISELTKEVYQLKGRIGQ